MFNPPEGISRVTIFFLLNSLQISPSARTDFYPKGMAGIYIPPKLNISHHHLGSRLRSREAVNPAIHTSSWSAALLSTATILHLSGWNSVMVHW